MKWINFSTFISSFVPIGDYQQVLLATTILSKVKEIHNFCVSILSDSPKFKFHLRYWIIFMPSKKIDLE